MIEAQHKFMRAHHVVAEIESGVHIMDERKAWFRDLLKNAIATCQDKITFWNVYKPSPFVAAEYPPGTIQEIIDRQRERLASYRAALARLD